MSCAVRDAIPSERMKILLRYECCRTKKQRISTKCEYREISWIDRPVTMTVSAVLKGGELTMHTRVPPFKVLERLKELLR